MSQAQPLVQDLRPAADAQAAEELASLGGRPERRALVDRCTAPPSGAGSPLTVRGEPCGQEWGSLQVEGPV